MTRINERLSGKSNHSDELKLHSCQYMGFITVHMLYLTFTLLLWSELVYRTAL